MTATSSPVATLTAAGHVFRFAHHGDHIGRVLARGQLYEADLLTWSAQNLPRDGLYVDVGACVGTHAVFWAVACGVRVVAFEPYSESYRLLLANIQRNGVADRVQAVPFAVGAQDGRASLSVPPDNRGMARLVPGRGVLVMPLDAWYWTQHVAVLKIDVEGAESDVLTGAAATLQVHRPHLLIECAPADRVPALDARLTAYGYQRQQTFGWTPTHHYAPSTARRAA